MLSLTCCRPLYPQQWRAAAAAALVAVATAAPAQNLPGTFSTAWVGNTGGTPDSHVMHTVDNAFVLPDGKVFAICEWDEGGANVSLFQNGVVMPKFLETGTGSWGRMSGKAITADGTYVYQAFSQDAGYGEPPRYPATGSKWHCVRRYFHNGQPAPFPGGFGYENSNNGNTAGSMLKVSDTKTPVGMVVHQQKLFVADPTGNGIIKVYDAANLAQTPIRTFSVSSPGLLAVDSQGYLWMLQKDLRRLVRFSQTGVMQAQQITLPASVNPTAFCIDKDDRLLLADAGQDLNIKVFANILSSPTPAGTFGTTRGIYSGASGVEGPLKFTHPTGVGTDAAGNIYVCNSTTGASVESYTASGTRNWRLDGLVFTAVGDLDPTTMSDVYLFNRRLKVDLSQPSGAPWQPYGYTLDPFRYPNDPRGPAGNIFMTSSLIRYVSGRKLLYTSDMYAGTLSAFRFDGEIAVPAGFFTVGTASEGAWPPNHPTGKEIAWVDGNGDGQMQGNEYDAKNADNNYGRGWWVDEAGGLWKTLRERGVRYFPCQGVSSAGVPQYSYATSVLYPIPANTLVDLQRICYDAAQDALYLTGWAAGDNGGERFWWSAGSAVYKFSRWKQGNRTPDWKIALEPASGQDKLRTKSFVVEGDYLFAALGNVENKGVINVYKIADGQFIGALQAGPEVGGVTGWTDINIAVTARRNSNGQYNILMEENGFGKVLLYRWCPTGTCSAAPLAAAPQLARAAATAVYPNPSVAGFTTLPYELSGETTVSYALCDGQGRLCQTETWREGRGAHQRTLDLRKLAPGLYSLRLTAGQKTSHQQLSVQ